MELRTLLNDDDAVSPVIGVILMVAITVILAAVIASFVLGLGDSAGDAAPQFSIECNTADGTITHAGGDTVSGSQLYVLNAGGSAMDIPSGNYSAGEDLVNSSQPSSATVSGDEQIRWDNPDGSSSNIVAEC